MIDIMATFLVFFLNLFLIDLKTLNMVLHLRLLVDPLVTSILGLGTVKRGHICLREGVHAHFHTFGRHACLARRAWHSI
jgi:hypothetical protein